MTEDKAITEHPITKQAIEHTDAEIAKLAARVEAIASAAPITDMAEVSAMQDQLDRSAIGVSGDALDAVKEDLENQIKEARMPAKKSKAALLGAAIHAPIDLLVKIYNDFRISSVACLMALLYMTYIVLSDVLAMKPEDVSPEFFGIVATLVAGTLGNIKMTLSERNSDSEDKREHSQWMERQALRIEVAREGLNVELEDAK